MTRFSQCIRPLASVYTVYVCCQTQLVTIFCLLQACVGHPKAAQSPTEPRRMSGTGNDEPRAKRRRCAPKRYAEEDDGSPACSTTPRLCSESSHEQKLQQQRQQHPDACHPAHLLKPCGLHTQVQPAGSEDEQALYAIQQLAMKLAKQGRPHLGDLFCQTNRNSPRHITIVRFVHGSIGSCSLASI